MLVGWSSKDVTVPTVHSYDRPRPKNPIFFAGHVLQVMLQCVCGMYSAYVMYWRSQALIYSAMLTFGLIAKSNGLTASQILNSQLLLLSIRSRLRL